MGLPVLSSSAEPTISGSYGAARADCYGRPRHGAKIPKPLYHHLISQFAGRRCAGQTGSLSVVGNKRFHNMKTRGRNPRFKVRRLDDG